MKLILSATILLVQLQIGLVISGGDTNNVVGYGNMLPATGRCLSSKMDSCKDSALRFNRPSAAIKAIRIGDIVPVVIEAAYYDSEKTLEMRAGTDRAATLLKQAYINNCYTSKDANGAYEWEKTNCYKNFTFMGFPKTDELTLLSVPGVAAPVKGKFDVELGQENVQSLMAQRTFHTRVAFRYNGVLYRSTPLPWVHPVTGRLIEYRMAIITLKRGVFDSIQWEKTSCKLQACSCLSPFKSELKLNENDGYAADTDRLYERCANCILGGKKNVTCNLDVYLGWSGTDSAGSRLMSGQSSPYQIENIL